MVRKLSVFSLLIFTVLASGLPASNAAVGKAALAPQAAPAPPTPAQVVRAKAYVSLEPVPRGRAFEVAVVTEILWGFHINAHKAAESYLIPTTLTPRFPEGFRALKATYPPGESLRFEFSDEPLLVYTGTMTLRMRIAAEEDAPLGKVTLPFTLRFQACNDTTCLPPVNVPVEVAIKVAPAGAKAHALNPKIFSGRESHAQD